MDSANRMASSREGKDIRICRRVPVDEVQPISGSMVSPTSGSASRSQSWVRAGPDCMAVFEGFEIVTFIASGAPLLEKSATKGTVQASKRTDKAIFAHGPEVRPG